MVAIKKSYLIPSPKRVHQSQVIERKLAGVFKFDGFSAYKVPDAGFL
jgi:hypothetical protein